MFSHYISPSRMFMLLIYFVVHCTITKHPIKWAVRKFGHEKWIHNCFLLNRVIQKVWFYNFLLSKCTEVFFKLKFQSVCTPNSSSQYRLLISKPKRFRIWTTDLTHSWRRSLSYRNVFNGIFYIVKCIIFFI